MSAFKATVAAPLQKQIADHLAQRIISGELADRSRLPSTVELARLYNVTPVTIHKSLQHLVKRQLIERRSREGTFVRSRERTNVIGLVFGKSPFSHPSNFYTSLITAFLNEAYMRDLNFKIYFDFETSSKTRFDLEQDVRSGELKGLVISNNGPALRNFIKRYPDMLRCNPMNIDFRNEVKEGLSYLAGHGYKRIGLVSMQPEELADEDSRTRFAAECRGMDEVSAEYKVQIEVRRYEHTEAAGYRKTLEWLGASPQRPEALFINHDMMVHGALLAIVQLGLRIPEDIALLIHMNSGNEFASPVPLSKYEIDIDQLVRNSLDAILKSIANGETGMIQLPVAPGKIIPGKSCGEK